MSLNREYMNNSHSDDTEHHGPWPTWQEIPSISALLTCCPPSYCSIPFHSPVHALAPGGSLQDWFYHIRQPFSPVCLSYFSLGFTSSKPWKACWTAKPREIVCWAHICNLIVINGRYSLAAAPRRQTNKGDKLNLVVFAKGKLRRFELRCYLRQGKNINGWFAESAAE